MQIKRVCICVFRKNRREQRIYGFDQYSCIGRCEKKRNREKLFEEATFWAQKQGAEKIYISAHSAVESQAFYKAMGCVEAKQYQQKYVEQEPFDCQLEYSL